MRVRVLSFGAFVLSSASTWRASQRSGPQRKQIERIGREFSMILSFDICVDRVINPPDSFAYHALPLHPSADFSLHRQRPGVREEPFRNLLCSLIPL